MYGKFFESTFTGSMFGAGSHVFAVWAYVIANTRKDSTVELNQKMLAAAIGCGVEEVERAIEYLCSPDEASRSKNEDGRRIVKEGEYLYRVVNHSSYREIRNEDERREYNRKKQSESRERHKKSRRVNVNVNDCQHLSAHTDADSNNTSSSPAAPKVERARNLELDELAMLAGISLKEIGPAVAKRLNKCLTTIRESTPDVTAEEIRKRAREYRAKMPDVTFSPEGLAKWWPSLAGVGEPGGLFHEEPKERVALPFGFGDWPQEKKEQFLAKNPGAKVPA